MNIQTIAEHSVDIDLLSRGLVIDGGCRGFQFSVAIWDLGCEVIAFDLEDMEVPWQIKFVKAALMDKAGDYHFVQTRDQQAKFISSVGEPVKGLAMMDVLRDAVKDGQEVDVLKMDLEGSEYFILTDPEFEPIPKQISIEWHEHCHKQLHDDRFEKCVQNLSRHYVAVQHKRTQAHGAGWNYWDSLFVRKDLVKTTAI
jgi:hypothetical protein